MRTISTLAKAARPLYMLVGALMYMLGAGIARYLGREIDSDLLFLGLLVAVLSPLSMMMLAVVFRRLGDPLADEETKQERNRTRNAALYVSIAALATMSFVTVLLLRTDSSSPGLVLTFCVAIAVILAFGVPPVRLIERGFGELLIAALLTYVAPSLGFLLQAATHHALLYACVAALTLLVVAMLIVLNLSGFAEDVKYDRGTLVRRMGWENALRVHHALVLGAYGSLLAATLSGFSFRLLGPAFLTMPFAVLEFYLLRSLAAGAPPMWKLLSANAAALFTLTAYFLTLSFWFR